MTVDNEFLLILIIGLLLIALVIVDVPALPAPLRWVRMGLGLIYVLWAPGYTLQAALFPSSQDLDGPERLALSFGLSVAVVPPMALILDALPWGIRLWPIVICETVFMVGFSAVALYRRQWLPEEELPLWRLGFSAGAWWAQQSRLERLVYGLLVVALLLFAIGAVAIIVTPKPGERLTEFYILGPEGLAENYPREVILGQAFTVTVGINNLEGTWAVYRVEVSDGQALIGGYDQVFVNPDSTDERSLSLVPTLTGEDVKIEFRLYRAPSVEPYRQLHLFIRVKEENATP